MVLTEKIIKHVVYPIHGIVTKRPMLGKLRELEDSQWWTSEQLLDLQWRKLQTLLIHAQTNVPYYRRTFADAGIDVRDFRSQDDIRHLPMLTKEMIRENRDALIAEGTQKSELRTFSTSGSTGQNMKFYLDNNCGAAGVASVMRNHRWMGSDIGELEVVIWGSPIELNASRKLSGRLNYALQGVKFISAYELKEDSILEGIEDMRRWKPSIVTGYTGALEVFARFMVDRGIKGIRPKGVICSAEMLFPHQREIIEKAFDSKVFNRYGCREFYTIAHECDCGGFHLNMERVFVESLPAEAAGQGYEAGELVVTDLDNFGSPMIRYRIGDMGVMEDSGQKCTCGRGLLMMKELHGRVFDVIKTSSGRVLPGVFWTILSKTVPGVDQLQIIQKSLLHIVANLKTNSTFTEGARDQLKTKIIEYCGQDTQVDINLVDRIEPTASGKLRFVISELKQ